MRFGDLFSRPGKGRAAVLVDVRETSVAGAYLYVAPASPPALLYTRRLPIEAREHEPRFKAMLRALSVLLDAMVREGAPALARTAGSGSVGSILGSIDAPWQETSVRTEHFEGDEPFTFTKNMVDEAIRKTALEPSSRVLADESIVGMLLNGYETRRPYGKRVRRAAVTILSSRLSPEAAEGARRALSEAYHTDRVDLIAGSALRYQALRAAFPHEHMMLIVDARGPLTSIELVRDNLLVAVKEVSEEGKERRGTGVEQALKELAGEYPLPRTIFLLAEAEESSSLEAMLASAQMLSLWLSEHPPKIVKVLPSHLRGLVVQTDGTPADLPLLLAALYAAGRMHLLKGALA